MRYRTAAISCFVLFGGLFGLPAVTWAMFLPSLKQGLPNPIPAYERVLLEIAVFCDAWKWLLALPMLALGLIFTVAAFATALRTRGGKVAPRSFNTAASPRR